MKKIFSVLLILVLILCGCSYVPEEPTGGEPVDPIPVPEEPGQKEGRGRLKSPRFCAIVCFGRIQTAKPDKAERNQL